VSEVVHSEYPAVVLVVLGSGCLDIVPAPVLEPVFELVLELAPSASASFERSAQLDVPQNPINNDYKPT